MRARATEHILMQRGDPAEQKRMRRRLAAERHAWPLDGQAGGPPNGVNGAGGSAPGKLWPDDPSSHDENPPWDRESARIPVPPSPGEDDGLGWEAMEQSYAGVSLQDMTGTGRMPAMVPLPSQGSGWTKGVTAPQGGSAVAPAQMPADMEAVDQPSAHIKALNRGNLARATLIVSVALLLSRVLGLFRTSLFTAAFGFGPEADAYTYAFTLPDALFNIVAGGALASAFIPVFADYLIDKRDKKAAWHITSSALNLSMGALTLLAVGGFFAAPVFLSTVFHDLFTNGNRTGPLAVQLTQIMLLQPIFLGGATVAIAVLQGRQHFVLPAIGQVIYTVSLIGGIALTLVDQKTRIFGGHLGIYGPTWGVVAGAALQLLIQIPGLVRARMEYTFSFDIFHPGVRKMFSLMLPRLANAAFLYLSVFVNRGLMTGLRTGAAIGYVTAFSLAMLPIGVFGMAVSQAAFPTLAALVAAGEWQRLSDTILRTVRGVIFLALPSALGLIVLADPISRLLLAHGHLNLADLPLVTGPLIAFSVGLLGLSLVEILTRCFYALHDTRTAVEVSVLQFLFVIGLSIILLQPMGANGLALATALGANGEALVLLLLLRPRIGGLSLRELGRFFLNVLAASVVCALTALFVYTLAQLALPIQGTSITETVYMIVRVGSSIIAATAVYFAFSRFLGTDDVLSLGRIVRRVVRR